jgi:hypothetical protein
MTATAETAPAPAETITLTRALAEIKVLGDRITKSVTASRFCGAVYGKDKSPVDREFKSADSLAARISGDWASIQDLLARRQAVKSAIARANVSTFVTIGGVEVSIADAVIMKNQIPFQEELLRVMRRDLSNRQAEVKKLEEDLDKKIGVMVGQAFQNVAKVTEEQYSSVAGPQLAQFKPELLDPLGVGEQIKALEDHIQEVKLHLDFRLSEINAITKIEIPAVAR